MKKQKINAVPHYDRKNEIENALIDAGVLLMAPIMQRCAKKNHNTIQSEHTKCFVLLFSDFL